MFGDDKAEFIPTAEEIELMRPMLEGYSEIIEVIIDATDRRDTATIESRQMEAMMKGMFLCGAFQLLLREHGLDNAGHFMTSPIRPSTRIEADYVADTGTSLPDWLTGGTGQSV